MEWGATDGGDVYPATRSLVDLLGNPSPEGLSEGSDGMTVDIGPEGGRNNLPPPGLLRRFYQLLQAAHTVGWGRVVAHVGPSYLGDINA